MEELETLRAELAKVKAEKELLERQARRLSLYLCLVVKEAAGGRFAALPAAIEEIIRDGLKVAVGRGPKALLPQERQAWFGAPEAELTGAYAFQVVQPEPPPAPDPLPVNGGLLLLKLPEEKPLWPPGNLIFSGKE